MNSLSRGDLQTRSVFDVVGVRLWHHCTRKLLDQSTVLTIILQQKRKKSITVMYQQEIYS